MWILCSQASPQGCWFITCRHSSWSPGAQAHCSTKSPHAEEGVDIMWQMGWTFEFHGVSGLSSQSFTLLQFVTPFLCLLFALGQKIYDVKSQNILAYVHTVIPGRFFLSTVVLSVFFKPVRSDLAAHPLKCRCPWLLTSANTSSLQSFHQLNAFKTITFSLEQMGCTYSYHCFLIFHLAEILLT